MLPRAVGEGRRIARNIHRLGRLYLTKSVYAAFLIALDGGARLHLPVPAPPPDGRGVPDDRHPVVRPRAGAERGAALPRAPADARSPRSRCPPASGSAVASLLSFFFVDAHLRRHARGGPDRGDDDADRARALLHPAARARAGPRAHRDPELHARDDRRARRALRADPRGRPGARLLRARDALRRPVVPVPGRGRRRARRSRRAGWRLPYIQQLESDVGKTTG